MPYGKSYKNDPAPGVPMNQRRQAAERVSHVNTKLRPRKEDPTISKLGTLKSYKKP